MTLKHKTSKSLSSLLTWANKNTVQVVSVVNFSKGVTMVYYDKCGSEQTELRLQVLADKIATHLSYPDTTKVKLGFPEVILGKDVVPFTRIKNSIRNLTAFKDLELSEVDGFMRKNLEGCGYGLLSPAEASANYRLKSALIFPLKK